MRRRHLLSIGVMAMAVATAGLVVAQVPEAPKPTPEHAKLGFFVGNWSGDGEMKPSPFGPGGKMKTTDRCEWWDGKFAVVCHNEGTSPMGPMKGLGILSYNADEKVYTYYGVDNTGMTMMNVPRGTVNGKTWTYTGEDKMGGVVVKSRYTIQELSPTSQSFKWEIQGEGGAWTTVAEGTSKKSS
jgi:hypothetical protein